MSPVVGTEHGTRSEAEGNDHGGLQMKEERRSEKDVDHRIPGGQPVDRSEDGQRGAATAEEIVTLAGGEELPDVVQEGREEGELRRTQANGDGGLLPQGISEITVHSGKRSTEADQLASDPTSVGDAPEDDRRTQAAVRNPKEDGDGSSTGPASDEQSGKVVPGSAMEAVQESEESVREDDVVPVPTREWKETTGSDEEGTRSVSGEKRGGDAPAGAGDGGESGVTEIDGATAQRDESTGEAETDSVTTRELLVVPGERVRERPRWLQLLSKWAPIAAALLAVLMAVLWYHVATSPRIINTEDMTPATPLRVQLPDGRFVAYHEWGVSSKVAEHTILVAHGMISSRLAGMPGIKPALLKQYAVRVISYDRPGFGQSDPHPSRTYKSDAEDMAKIADLLNTGERFWVLGYSGGGPHAWAAARFIPHRVEGIVLWAPMGSPFWSSLSADEGKSIWSQLPSRLKMEFSLARMFPWLVSAYMKRIFLPRFWQGIADIGLQVGKKDREFLKWHGLKIIEDDIRESLRQGNGNPVAEELLLYANDWGFSLEDLNRNVTGNDDDLHVQAGNARSEAADSDDGFLRTLNSEEKKAVPGNDSSADKIPEEAAEPSSVTPLAESDSDASAEECSMEEEKLEEGIVMGDPEKKTLENGEPSLEGDVAGGEKIVKDEGHNSRPSEQEKVEEALFVDDGKDKGTVEEKEAETYERKGHEEEEEEEKGRQRVALDVPIHIWHGTDDLLVPVAFSHHAKRLVPRAHLHLLPGHGHFSWFCHCDTCHREVLAMLFGAPPTRSARSNASESVDETKPVGARIFDSAPTTIPVA